MRVISIIIFISCVIYSCQVSPGKQAIKKYISKDNRMENKEVAIFAGGCFWCIEAPLMLLEGVDTVVSGYIGGKVANPTYAQVCTGNTGHAEAVRITYDPQKISYEELMEVFFTIHDPTQLNRQGNDIGTQYRSAIFPTNDEQAKKAEFYLHELDKSGAYTSKLVTTIEFDDTFYVAEDYHQNYYNNNPEQMYCQLVARPKVEKVKKVFEKKLKTN